MSGYENSRNALSSVASNSATTRPGSRTPGSGLSRKASTPLKIAVFTPTPSASVTTATSVNPGRCASTRSPYLMSCNSVCIATSMRNAECGMMN